MPTNKLTKLKFIVKKEELEALIAEHIVPQIISGAYRDNTKLIEFDCYSSEENPTGDYRFVIEWKPEEKKPTNG